MKRRDRIRMAVDLGMTVILLLLTAYSRVGETAHEWLGIAMFALFAAHHRTAPKVRRLSSQQGAVKLARI